VGALFNLLGDSLTAAERITLKEMMVDGVVLGALRSAIFDPVSDTDVPDER
jgi:hypothetical protein